MAIQPLFNGPLFLPSRQLVSASNSQAVTADEISANVDSGPETGNVLDKKDSDFTDPIDIQDLTTQFSDSIKPTTSNTLLVQLGVDPDPLGKNPDSVDILNSTQEAIDLINDPAIGRDVRARANSDPLRWKNPSALDILVGISSTGGSLVTTPNAIITPGSAIIQTPGGTVVLPTVNANASSSDISGGNVQSTGGRIAVPAQNNSLSRNELLQQSGPVQNWLGGTGTQDQTASLMTALSAVSGYATQPALTSPFIPGSASLWTPSVQNSFMFPINQYYATIQSPQPFPIGSSDMTQPLVYTPFAYGLA